MIISVERVGKSFENIDMGTFTLVLDDVSFSVNENEFLCFLGPSGCGKSTLLNLVAGFIKPSTGTIRFNGAPVVGPGPDRGVVFQDPTLFPWLTACRNVEFGLQALGVDRTHRRSKALHFLDLVGLTGFCDAYPHELSGGMRQRVALARVLALEPLALLMDEPFSALDANARERLQDELLRIWAEHLKTVLFVTHNVEEAAYLADRVIVMGPAPTNTRTEFALRRMGNRSRSSHETLGNINLLRGALAEFPCCIPPRQRGNIYEETARDE
jgi:NitT/TauT family transport system ATP-binding protein